MIIWFVCKMMKTVLWTVGMPAGKSLNNCNDYNPVGSIHGRVLADTRCVTGSPGLAVCLCSQWYCSMLTCILVITALTKLHRPGKQLSVLVCFSLIKLDVKLSSLAAVEASSCVHWVKSIKMGASLSLPGQVLLVHNSLCLYWNLICHTIPTPFWKRE